MPPLTVVQTTTDVVTLVHLYRVTRGKLAFLLGTIRTKRTRSPIRYVVYSISCSYHDALFAYSIVYCVTTQDNAPPVKSAEDDSDLPASSSDSDLPTSSSNGNNNYNGQVLSCGRCGDRATLIAAVEHYGTVVFREGGQEWIIRRDDVAMMHALRFGNDAGAYAALRIVDGTALNVVNCGKAWFTDLLKGSEVVVKWLIQNQETTLPISQLSLVPRFVHSFIEVNQARIKELLLDQGLLSVGME